MVKEAKNDIPLLTKVRLGVYVILCAAMVVAMGFLLYIQDQQIRQFRSSNYSISKDDFHCSRTVSVGKGVDQVACVQYTHERIFRDVVEPPPGVRPQGAAVAPAPQNAAPRPPAK